MRLLYVVTYDISDKKRLRKVFRLMRGYGDHLQLSVFRCELSGVERFELLVSLAR
jgi:CRISPR-associated protein Cas2